MKNNVNPENKSSVWWWTQWLLTGLVVCVLSYFLYSFVMAATENVCITDVTCLSPDNGVKNTKRISASIYGVSSNRQTDDAAFKLKTLVVDHCTSVRLLLSGILFSVQAYQETIRVAYV